MNQSVDSVFVKELFETMPDQWTGRRLKFLSRIRFSNVNKISEPDETEVRLCNYIDVYKNDHITNNLDFMKTTATDDEIERFSLLKDDVLITKDSETADDIGVPSYVGETIDNLVCGYHLAILRSNEELLGEFLFRYLQSTIAASFFEKRANGITRFSIGLDTVGSCPIIYPSKAAQLTIVSFLEKETQRIDSLIEKKEHQIELLQEKRQAIITKAVTKGLDPSAKIKSSGVEWIPELPSHWQLLRAKNLFYEVDERSLSGDEELLSVSHLTGVSKRSEKQVNMFMAETLEGYKKCQKNDLVINTMWAWMGAIGVASETGIVSPSYNVYRFRSASLYPSFYDLLVRVPPFVKEVGCFSKGVWTSRLRLYPEEFFSILLPVPPYKEQVSIVDSIQTETGNYYRLQTKLNCSIELLQEYRSSLISAAISGQIDVSKFSNGARRNATLQ
jgi:type I restriction enzyme S subunit